MKHRWPQSADNAKPHSKNISKTDSEDTHMINSDDDGIMESMDHRRIESANNRKSESKDSGSLDTDQMMHVSRRGGIIWKLFADEIFREPWIHAKLVDCNTLKVQERVKLQCLPE